MSGGEDGVGWMGWGMGDGGWGGWDGVGWVGLGDEMGWDGEKGLYRLWVRFWLWFWAGFAGFVHLGW